ncbi:N-acetylmuramoyl-L-alanine amidase [Rhodohalobacter sp.]|uniref:N-acetylmuramoyl-L-alanine amidase n=1 Tax=Rhodohalobacter sp. TaxID=1974210 RepID=UPI002ACE1157|nr:N-acetylmuramoyl-L-alanine amidase [Rhodohalobacter sp.]MDZ7757013.1 N-acetylmuramoyl-L-alanine amidase [Rhodohalobacter sp.]
MSLLPRPLIFIAGIFLISIQAVQAQDSTPLVQPDGMSILAESDQLPRTEWIWSGQTVSEHLRSKSSDRNTIKLQGETEQPFTGLAVGWKPEENDINPNDFTLRIRSSALDEMLGDWTSSYGYISAEESPSGFYWAMLYVTESGKAHDKFEVEIEMPAGVRLQEIRITGADARLKEGDDFENVENAKIASKSYDMPEIVDRSGWWGDLPASELEPSYSPTPIDISHAIAHHTVTANEPANPAQVVRQIWDWHVNDNGWLDIGYNFLIDHEGMIYQGRYNPNLEETDVRGAHAGSANSQSVGIALLGQFEPGAQPAPGQPQALALDALVKTIGWRFTQKGIDSQSSGFIAGNYLPVISGHRDVSATACPGENLYQLLPDIRSEVETGSSEPPEEVVDYPFELNQNYPNPFSNETTISFSLDEDLIVTIDIYNVNGVHLERIYENETEAGEHDVNWTPTGLASGVYFYEIEAGNFRQMKQMIYIR